MKLRLAKEAFEIYRDCPIDKLKEYIVEQESKVQYKTRFPKRAEMNKMHRKGLDALKILLKFRENEIDLEEFNNAINVF